MAKVELQIKGREALQKRLNEKRQQIISYLNMRLMQLAEEAVTYSKENKGYQDRTANLKTQFHSLSTLTDNSLPRQLVRFQRKKKRKEDRRV